MLPAIDAKSAYVSLMMGVIGRGLVAASQTDPEIRRELSAFPAGYRIRMQVFPNGVQFCAEIQADGTLKLIESDGRRATLGIFFKHIEHAFLVCSFQEGTAQAFANDRIFVDGELAHAVRLLRCLNRMEVLVLPKQIAERAVKRYPFIAITEKLPLAGRIYGRLLANLFRGA